MLDQFLDFYPNFGVDTALLLIVLVALEAVLSADNAIALAAIAQGLEDKDQQRKALNLGLVAAFILRISLILVATWVIRFWQFELLGAIYLLWLAGRYFLGGEDEDGNSDRGFHFDGLWQAVPTIAVTDLAFSLDSVTTAIAISDETWLVLTGGTIGVITLRFMAGLFIRWLEEYERLEAAGYVTVGLVGVRLVLRSAELASGFNLWVPPDWFMIVCIGVIFAWGFSVRCPPDLADVAGADAAAGDKIPDVQQPVDASASGGSDD